MVTFANILSAATEIILERGVKGLNTNLVAERAAINVGTVYHYFPDKTAILTELFRLQQKQRDDVLFEKLSELATTPDVRGWTRELFELLRQLRLDQPTAVPLRRAFNSIPRLAELDRVETARYARYLAKLLERRFSSVDERRADAVAHLLITISVAVLDSPLMESSGSTMFLDEAVRLVGIYFDDLGH